MNMRFLPVLLVALVFTGCTQTHQIAQTSDVESEYTFSTVHNTLEGQMVDIELADGRTMPSVALRIVPDSTAWIDLMTDQLRTADTPKLASITHRRPGRGAVQGASFGAVGGSLLGLAVGFLLLPQQNEDAILSESGFVSRFVAGGAILGTGVGMGIGTSRASHDRYVYPDLPLDTQYSVAGSNQ